MRRVLVSIGAVLMALLLTTTPVAATAPLVSQSETTAQADETTPEMGSGIDAQLIADTRDDSGQ